jgi:plasmid stabilization system protein ParE
MTFRVELSDRAQSDIAAIYDWLLSQQAESAGERRFVALREAIASLSTLPTRRPISAESLARR